MAMSGKPAILDPRTFDLRAFQSSIQNIRERFRLLDTAVSSLQGTVGGSNLNAQVVTMQQQLVSLQTQITNLTSALGVNDTTTLIADEVLEIGMAVVATGAERCAIADPTDPTAFAPVVGLVSKAAAAGQAATIQRRGALSLQGASFDPGYTVYAGADGELVQHPSYGAVAIPVGVAVSSTAVWISPGAPVLLIEGFDSEHERYMAASVQLVTDAIELATQFAMLPDGLFVKVGDTLMPRRLVEGTQIWIDNPDGVAGNPVIRYVPAGEVRTLETAAATDSSSAVLGP